MKGKSIIAAALVGALTFGGSVCAFASTNSDTALATEVTTVSNEATATDDTSLDSTTSTNDTTDSIKEKYGHRKHGKNSVKSEISALVDEGYTLEDAKASVLAEKLAKIDAKVTDGTLTSEEAESFKEKITEKINSYIGEETTEDTTDKKYKRNGNKKSSLLESKDDTSSDITN